MRFVIALAICLLATSSYADTYKREVPANKGAVVDGIGYFNRSTCTSAAMPKVKIKKQPKHGKLILKPSTGPVSRDKTICKGKQINAMYVIYQPERGYRGKDEASISFQVFGSGPKTIYGGNTYKITVK